jgi:hypothetical protein
MASISRFRSALLVLPLVVLFATAWRHHPVPAGPVLHVVKTPTCGCCQAWVDYMKAQGFTVTVENRADLSSFKREHGVTRDLESCHTGVVDGIVVEGHVPADLVKKVLRDRPAGVKGIAVPGMPLGSPGMEAPTSQRYTVYTFDARGNKTPYANR